MTVRYALPRLLGGSALLLFVSAAFAQTPEEAGVLAAAERPSPIQPSAEAVPALAPPPSAVPGGIRFERAAIEGATLVPVAALGAVAERYAGRPLAEGELSEMADALSGTYQARGYYLSRAEIPAQRVDDGVLTLRLSEGRIARIDAEGSGGSLAARRLAGLVTAEPALREDLDAAVAEARRLPGLTLEAVRPVRLARDEYALAVDASLDRWDGRVFSTNKGARGDDPVKAYLGAGLNGAVAPGDRLSVGVLTKPGAPGDLLFGELRYDAPPTRGGLVPFAGLTASRTAPSGLEGPNGLGDRDLDGSLFKGTLGVSGPFALTGSHRTAFWRGWVEASRVTENEDGLELFTDRIRAARLALRYGRRGDTTLAANATVSVGGANSDAGRRTLPDGTQATLRRARPDAEGTFATLRGSLLLTRRAGPVLARAGASGQVSAGPLTYQEEYALGGGEFGRGYDFGEVLGDHGLAGYVEAAVPITRDGPMGRVEPYLFADAGTTWNAGEGLVADGQVLASAGGGLRLRLTDALTLEYEAAQPLSDAPYTQDDDDLRHRFELLLLY